MAAIGGTDILFALDSIPATRLGSN
jgi:predicted tellurium resistance membrane protein TerC